MTSTTEQVPGSEQMAPDVATGPRGRLARFVGAFAVGLTLTAVLVVGVFVAFDGRYAGLVLPGVSVGTVDLSGLPPAEARDRLTAAYAGLAEGTLVIEIPDATVPVPYATLGRRIAAETLVDEAKIGRAHV